MGDGVANMVLGAYLEGVQDRGHGAGHRGQK